MFPLVTRLTNIFSLYFGSGGDGLNEYLIKGKDTDTFASAYDMLRNTILTDANASLELGREVGV